MGLVRIVDARIEDVDGNRVRVFEPDMGVIASSLDIGALSGWPNYASDERDPRDSFWFWHQVLQAPSLYQLGQYR